MPAPLQAPRVPPGFPPLATASGLTMHLGSQTVSPGGQTALGTEVGGQTPPPPVQRLTVRPPP
jgi:hypothetical protein